MEHEVKVLRILGRWSNEPPVAYKLRFELSIDGISVLVDQNMKWSANSKSNKTYAIVVASLHFHNPLIKKAKDYNDIRGACIRAIQEW